MSYWRCHYHLIWATHQRLPVLDEAREQILARAVAAIGDEKSAIIHAFEAVFDHVHVALSFPPRYSISEVAQHLKGSTSHQLARTASPDRPWSGWQREYGVLTFGDGSMERVVDYVRNQKTHHQTGTIWTSFERLGYDPSMASSP